MAHLTSLASSLTIALLVPMEWNSAKDLMTTDVRTVGADWSDQVSEFLIDHDISGAPVVQDEQLVGVISVTDIARHSSTAGELATDRPATFYRSELRGNYAEEDLDDLRISQGGETTAKQVMTPQIYDVNKHTSIQQVAEVMHRGDIHRVFVTEDGQIAGIITALDMLKVVAAM